jgi:hypothetical protein
MVYPMNLSKLQNSLCGTSNETVRNGQVTAVTTWLVFSKWKRTVRLWLAGYYFVRHMYLRTMFSGLVLSRSVVMPARELDMHWLRLTELGAKGLPTCLETAWLYVPRLGFDKPGRGGVMLRLVGYGLELATPWRKGLKAR